MKRFEPFSIDFARCRHELDQFKAMLDWGEALKERRHILAFFREHRQVAALLGLIAPEIAEVDRIAYEFDFFGDYAADLAVGDSHKREYCFVEFEEAAPDSIFRRAGDKHSLEWSRGFDRGYSQITDWFWKLHDLSRSEAGRERFGHEGAINYCGLLVIGRSRGLAPNEVERLRWRRSRVLVDSRHVYCMTFDELYDDLAFRLSKAGLVSPADSSPIVRARPARGLLRRKKKPRRSLGGDL